MPWGNNPVSRLTNLSADLVCLFRQENIMVKVLLDSFNSSGPVASFI